MLLMSLDSLDEVKLQQLCDERCPESGTLDFKRDLPSSSDRDKHEFLKDVCALANSGGGDLVYGIDESGGVASSIVPIAEEIPDAAKRRLGQVLDAGLEPRLSGVQFRDVPVVGGFVLVVRVPPSFIGPHRYLFNNHSKFVMRNGTHNVELTYEQLRMAFDRTSTLADRAQQFRADRIKAIVERRTWKPLMAGPLCVVHVIPIEAMAGRRQINMQALYNDYTPFTGPMWSGGSRTLNLDGLVVHPGVRRDDEAWTFNQIFRNGAIETIFYGGRQFAEDDDDGRRIIPSTVVSVYFHDAIQKFLRATSSLGFHGPAVVACALLFVGDYEFGVGVRYHAPDRALADRHHLVLPEIWVDDLSAAHDVDSIARPILDVLWQSFDEERCLEYSAQGVWSPRR